ncbi:uncharacterized protein LOC110946501 [Acanthochromis polyacanthus]|uniref:uncharacterized protein LOC110946501 n=1 Tax=Acanthochromis polyacanthus TaxID=80966 RepID=UPI002234B63A|nr:uncharacterized protein LOC110946501 [Acanthochromis polyacanthus]
MTGVVRWNYQRLVDLKQPGVNLPSVFDPQLIADLNSSCLRVTGQQKYPALTTSQRDTGERFGLRYVEPGCRPLVFNWDKSEVGVGEAVPQPLIQAEEHQPEADMDVSCQEMSGEILEKPVPVLGAQLVSVPQPFTLMRPVSPHKTESDLPAVDPLPITASPRATRTGPVKAGGLIHVLDHPRWTQPMRVAIDGLLVKRRGTKDMLRRVDAEYAFMVQSTCTDPNSLVHPTTWQHISRYVKHLAKLKNTHSAFNTSSEQVTSTQQLWHTLTTGSKTTSVPVTTLPPPVLSPPTVQSGHETLTWAAVEQIVQEALKQQKQQQQPLQPPQQETKEKKRTRTCLACGQPKSRYLGDGSTIHFFYQSATVKYFYCSTKVHQKYSSEGLTNPRMTFEEFSASPFFERELEGARDRGDEWKRVKSEREKKKVEAKTPTGRCCRFCHIPLKQGPGSPHIHTGFPGVPGKYIYCPSKVFSVYRSQGMTKELTWREFQRSAFYEVERDRWVNEKEKQK